MNKYLIAFVTLVLSTLAVAKDAAPVGSEHYVYRKKTAETKQAFWSMLPPEVQKEVETRYPNFDYVTACKSNFSGGGADFVVSVVAKGSKTGGSHVFFTGHGKVTRVFDIKNEDIVLSGSPEDYFETYCNKGSRFRKDDPMAAFRRWPEANEPILYLKTFEMNGFMVFAFDKKTNSFSSIGGVSPP